MTGRGHIRPGERRGRVGERVNRRDTLFQGEAWGGWAIEMTTLLTPFGWSFLVAMAWAAGPPIAGGQPAAGPVQAVDHIVLDDYAQAHAVAQAAAALLRLPQRPDLSDLARRLRPAE